MPSPYAPFKVTIDAINVIGDGRANRIHLLCEMNSEIGRDYAETIFDYYSSAERCDLYFTPDDLRALRAALDFICSRPPRMPKTKGAKRQRPNEYVETICATCSVVFQARWGRAKTCARCRANACAAIIRARHRAITASARNA
jgi:hypothetical protein